MKNNYDFFRDDYYNALITFLAADSQIMAVVNHNGHVCASGERACSVPVFFRGANPALKCGAWLFALRNRLASS